MRQAKSGASRKQDRHFLFQMQARPTLERERALEFQRAVGCDVGQPELVADIHGEFRTGWLWGIAFRVVVIALADVAGLLVVIVA